MLLQLQQKAEANAEDFLREHGSLVDNFEASAPEDQATADAEANPDQGTSNDPPANDVVKAGEV